MVECCELLKQAVCISVRNTEYKWNTYLFCLGFVRSTYILIVEDADSSTQDEFIFTYYQGYF